MSLLGDWTPPWPMNGETSFERVAMSHLHDRVCAEQVAKKARPEIWPALQADFVETQSGTFPLALAREAIIEVLGRSIPSASDLDGEIEDALKTAASASKADWHPLSLEWAGAAVLGYLQWREGLSSSGSLPASRVFGDVRGLLEAKIPLETYAWGIWHFAEEGRLREVHLPRWQDADGVHLSDVQVALAAGIAASGVIIAPGKWDSASKRAAVQAPHAPVRVRVRVVGLLDQTQSVLFDGSADEAMAAFTRLAVPAFSTLSGGGFRPSRYCASCALRRFCPGLPRRPGLLGTTGYSTATRSLTPSDITSYRMCPERLWLERDLGLPQVREGSPALQRGIQVHAWLAAAHTRGIPCSSEDLPDPTDIDMNAPLPASAGIAHDLGWTAEEYTVSLPYLVGHLEQCPITASVVTANNEHTLTAWDTDANVVVSTRADLSFSTDDGRSHLRETKTLNLQRLPEKEADLLWHFPQVALAICMLADDPDLVPGNVELELLSKETGALVSFDASNPSVVLAARTAIADAVDAWLYDTAHKPPRNAPCRWCPMRRVCPDASEVESAWSALGPDTLDGLIDTMDWSAPQIAVAIGYTGHGDGEEEFPF